MQGNSPLLNNLIRTNFIEIAVSNSAITQLQEILFLPIYLQWLKSSSNNPKVYVHFNHENNDNNTVNPNYAFLLFSLRPFLKLCTNYIKLIARGEKEAVYTGNSSESRPTCNKDQEPGHRQNQRQRITTVLREARDSIDPALLNQSTTGNKYYIHNANCLHYTHSPTKFTIKVNLILYT